MSGVAVSLLLSLPFVYVLVRKPVLRRLALRNLARRPREALLVVVGSLLGAAIVTGSFVVGDTLDASIRSAARAHLGPIDELVVARDASAQRTLARRLGALPRQQVDGVLPLTVVDAAVVSTNRGVIRSAPAAQVIALDFAAGRRFGGDAGATGLAGPTPPLDHAAITSDLARRLEVVPGDVIDIHAYGAETNFFVDRILPRRGIAGYSRGELPESWNVLVSPASLRVIAAPRHWPSGRSTAPPTWTVAVSNRGGVEGGVGLTDAVVRSIGATAGRSVQTIAVKRTVLDEADAVGKAFRDMFTGMGAFGVLAGVLLLVNLFVMLAAERKAELGMARAVGMRRAALVGAFATEGWLYALASAVAGAAAGIGLGRAIVVASQWAFRSEHSQLELTFTVRPGSVAAGFAIGFAVALVTVVATSVRVSRLNIIRAIRDLPEPAPRRTRRGWLVAGAFGALAGAVWLGSALPAREPWGLLLAPMLLAAGLVPAASRLCPPKAALGAGALAILAWAVAVFGLFDNAFEGTSIFVFIVQGIVATGAAVVVVALLQERIGTVLRALGVGRRLSLRLGLAYPLARRSRTAMTVAMYALVVFILTFITTLSHLIHAQVGSATSSVAGGYALIVDSRPGNPIAPARLAGLPGVRGVAPLSPALADFTPAGWSKSEPWRLTAFDERFVAGGAPRLEDRGSYATDEDAWRAVLRDPGLAIVDPVFLQRSGGPAAFAVGIGDRLLVADPFSGRSRTVTVAALSPADMFVQNGAFVGLPGARELFGARLEPTRAYLALDPGVDADRFAAALQGRFVDHGAQAASLRALMDEAFAMTNRTFQLFEGYLAMGLVVGIAGLAVVMVRAVRERRRQIGTLRALGFQPRAIGRSFAIESGFVALEGTLIGAGLALVTLYDIVALSDAMGDYTGFGVPIGTLAALLVGTVAASLLATVGPAVAASRIRPAVALRTAD
jgi:putative ABC transport system permease protein